MNRRAFLAGLTATAAGLLVPERKVWALDRTMITPVYRWIDGAEVNANVTGFTKGPIQTHFVVSDRYLYGFTDGDIKVWDGIQWHDVEWGWNCG